MDSVNTTMNVSERGGAPKICIEFKVVYTNLLVSLSDYYLINSNNLQKVRRQCHCCCCCWQEGGLDWKWLKEWWSFGAVQVWQGGVACGGAVGSEGLWGCSALLRGGVVTQNWVADTHAVLTVKGGNWVACFVTKMVIIVIRISIITWFWSS